MNWRKFETRLDDISTKWNLLETAKDGLPDEATKAIHELFLMYINVSNRYLLVILKDKDHADEAFQEFSLRFLQGDFVVHAQKDRGKFRKYLKEGLRNIAKDFLSRARKYEFHIPVYSDYIIDKASDFPVSSRNELLCSAWDALHVFDNLNRKNHHVVLSIRVDNPNWTSSECAYKLSEILEKNMTPGAYRQALSHARHQFALCLLDQVVIQTCKLTPNELEEELADLELLTICKPYLEIYWKCGSGHDSHRGWY